MLDSVQKDAKTILVDHQRYRESLNELLAKKEVLSRLYADLTFTDDEKKILNSNDERQSAVDKSSSARHRREV